MPRRETPATASIAEKSAGRKLFAPSAARNQGIIADLLSEVAPKSGRALELASGTGQHIVTFARRMPDINWQPSEIDPIRRDSITAYRDETQANNIQPPLDLDATSPGWSKRVSGFDLIVVVNLLHLISYAEAQTLIEDSALALAPGGMILIYGPFMRGGELTSDGDRRFHQSLVELDSAIGYKNDAEIKSLLESVQLITRPACDMPANNLAFIARRPG